MTRWRPVALVLFGLILPRVSIDAQVPINLIPTRDVSRDESAFRAPQGQERPQVAVLGGASAGTGLSQTAATAAAIFGFQVWESNYHVAAKFNLGDPDVITADQEKVGAYLLNPGFSGLGFNGGGNIYLTTKDKAIRPGLGLRVGLSRSDWEDVQQAKKVGGFVAYVVPTAQIISGDLVASGNTYTLGFEIGWGWRFIGGDLLQDDEFRTSVLGTSDSSFSGLEATFFVRMSNLSPYVRLTKYSSDVHIRGFSGYQAIFGLDVMGTIFHGQTEGGSQE